MLAYSSIAHSGYMAIAICAIGSLGGEFPYAAVLYYLIGYAIISIGSFGILMWLENDQNDNITLDNLSGMATKHPKACFALAVFMFAFAGMPPTVGFISKFFVFNAALKANLVSLVIIGIIGSSISLYYYLRVIVRMFMSESVKVAAPLAPKNSVVVSLVVGIAVILVVLLGTVLPGPVMDHLISTSLEIARN
jgi:NADH-quinone oxidoreductase subunit N